MELPSTPRLYRKPMKTTLPTKTRKEKKRSLTYEPTNQGQSSLASATARSIAGGDSRSLGRS